MEMQFNIIGDYAQILRERLRIRRYEECSIDSIKDDYNLVLAYFGALRRMVSMVKRTVFKANGFMCPQEYVSALAEIERKIERGENINPYLSRKLRNLCANDELLNDWGIQHLHLGISVITKKKNRGFIEGTPKLLFAYFDDQSAYFIVIGDHDSFGEAELLQILHDNWPEVLEKSKNPNIRSVAPDHLTSKQRDQMRRAGYNMGANVMRDGTAYVMVGGGIMSSGDNTLDVYGTNRLHTWAHRQTNNLRDLAPEIVAELKRRHGLEVVEPITLKLIVEGRSDSRWFLIDDNNHVTVGLGNPWEDRPPMIFYFFDDSTFISRSSCTECRASSASS
ncbi:MAG: hypothetical protein OXJ90_17715 [Spirochaetaceae bacterium]|nr:hypothetical protein [Spirochaetaceae bacterium]